MKNYVYIGGLFIASAALVFAYSKRVKKPKQAPTEVGMIHAGANLRIETEITETCREGELDTMQEYITLNDPVVVSVEPLTEKATKAQYFAKETLFSEIYSKPRVNVALDKLALAADGHYGIFMCSDKTQKGRCFGKNALKFQGFHRDRYKLDKADDKIFYFQYVRIQKGNVYFLNLNNIEEKSLKSVLDKKLRLSGSSNDKNIHQYVFNMTTRLGSFGIGASRTNGAYRLITKLTNYDEQCNPMVQMSKRYKHIESKVSLEKRGAKWQSIPKITKN